MTVGKIAVVVGVGPGTGGEAAKRFAAEGYQVALVTRKAEYAQSVQGQIKANGGTALIVEAYTGKKAEVERAYKEIVAEFKASPEVLIYNARGGLMRSWPPPKILDLDPEEFQDTFETGVTGALLWLQQVVPEQIAAGKGTIIFTGATAALRGGAHFPMLSPYKFALRSLSQVAARDFQSKGIHVVHVVIDGRIKARPLPEGENEEAYLLPEAIADTYWALHKQHRSAWTQELDLRPYIEKF